MKRILIINIFGIGDVLFTTPLLKNIRAQWPDTFVGYICNRRAFQVLENNPHINKIFIYERDEFRAVQDRSLWQAFGKWRMFFQEIRAGRFDIVIDFSMNGTFSFLMYAAGIPKRIGFNFRNRSLFLTDKINIDGFEGAPAAEYYLEPLRKLGVAIQPGSLAVYSTEKDRAAAADILNASRITADDFVIGWVPGGGTSWGRDADCRRWAPEHHAALADLLMEKYAARIVLLGDLSEQELASRMRKAMRCRRVVDLTGHTSIGQYLAVLSRCRLVFVNDGGPLHMAVAAGARTVSLIGPVDAKVYGPYPPDGHLVITKDIACRPCYRSFRRARCGHVSCLQTLTVPEVFAKVDPFVAKLLKSC